MREEGDYRRFAPLGCHFPGGKMAARVSPCGFFARRGCLATACADRCQWSHVLKNPGRWVRVAGAPGCCRRRCWEGAREASSRARGCRGVGHSAGLRARMCCVWSVPVLRAPRRPGFISRTPGPAGRSNSCWKIQARSAEARQRGLVGYPFLDQHPLGRVRNRGGAGGGVEGVKRGRFGWRQRRGLVRESDGA